MAKEKKRNYEEKAKNEVLSEETRNALLGILFFLVAAIGLVETAGPIGRIIRYVFVYLLGTYSSFITLSTTGCLDSINFKLWSNVRVGFI